MSKLPCLTPQKVAKILEKAGFKLIRVRSSHHIYFNPITRRTVIVPFHKKDITRGLFNDILKEAGINREELDDLL